MEKLDSNYVVSTEDVVEEVIDITRSLAEIRDLERDLSRRRAELVVFLYGSGMNLQVIADLVGLSVPRISRIKNSLGR